MSYIGSIDTDAGIGSILSNFSSEYIDHAIEDSLHIRFRPFNGPMPNMVDVLERQFSSISINSPDYIDKVNEVRLETFREIIIKICNYYNFTFVGQFDSMSPEEIYGIAHTMYEIFISRFTDYMNNFIVSYIIDNADSISTYLKNMEESNKPKDSGLYSSKNYIDPKFILIHANINTVIYNMAAYDIPLETLLSYFLDPSSAQRLGSLLEDNGDVFKTHYAYFILDQRYSAGVLTNVKLSLQARTQEVNQI